MKLTPIRPHQQYKSKTPVFQVVDLEARDWIDFIVGGFYDGSDYFEFRHLDEFTDYVMNSEKSLNIFAHFGGGYDFLFLLKNFLENKVKIQTIIPRGSSILTFKVEGIYKTHTFRDSAALLPFKLKTLTENFNVETKKGDYDHSLNRGYSQELADYLKDDCLGLYQVIEKFYSWDLIKRSGSAGTIASQAQKILRTYLKSEIYSLPNAVNEFCRLACHGGRTEIFRPLGKDLIEVDCNSLYPFVMSENFFPAGQAISCHRIKKDKLGIYRVKVTTPKNIFLPIIPYKGENKLLFPVGTFTSVITSAEIEYATKLGYKFEFISGYYFKSKEKYFTEFIKDLYNIREKSEKSSVENMLAKLIMNSSFGKFAIDPNKSNLIFDAELGAKHFRDIEINSHIVEIFEKDVELQGFKHSAIGAFILAYARLHMHKKALPLQDHLYYTDTDSLFLDIETETGTKLGEFKRENKHDECCFLLPKTYVAESKDYKKLAMKGFDARKIKHLTIADFKAALAGDLKRLDILHDKTISRFRSALMKNKILMHKKAFTKGIKAKYNKRTLIKLNNKITSIPLVINEL